MSVPAWVAREDLDEGPVEVVSLPAVGCDGIADLGAEPVLRGDRLAPRLVR